MAAETPTAVAIGALAPISLDELNASAALMTRTDRKYILPAAAIPRLLGGSGARALSISERRAMAYESVYLDTPERASYHGAARGVRRRFKVRTRHYADTGQRWLEVKTRGVRGLTVKRRIPYTPNGSGRLDNTGRQFVADRLADGGVRGIDLAGLQPALRTDYLRSTLLLTDRTTRVTIDQGLTWSAAGQSLRVGPVVIVETKTAGGAPSSADRALWADGHRPVRLSKYGTGMRLLDDDLPGNKWQRVIRAQLGGVTTCR